MPSAGDPHSPETRRAGAAARAVEHRQATGDRVDLLGQIRDGARLAALRDLELLDAAPEASIDRLTRLATELLGVPVSLVSLVDADRQFFLSQQGLKGEFARARQTPLSHSFCQHAVATREPLIVEDARKDPLLAENLAIRDIDVIAYAGMPLVLEDGNAVGAFCAIDDRPRRWTDKDLGILADLAATVKAILDLRGELAAMGVRDRLTGLPNRSLLVAYCEELLAREAGGGGGMVAVLCAGIDNFNQVNQAFGTDEADEVLRAVARRLADSVREADFFGRLRGDVFTLVAAGIHDEAEAFGIARRLRDALAERPLEIGETSVRLAVTVGIATGHRQARGSDLISEAANAMRRAKRHHTHVHLAEEGWSEQAVAQLHLRDALAGALGRGEITAAFQPIVDLETGEVVGSEVLARWTHPQLGAVGPADFIPLAEVTADVLPIGEWMLDRALGRLAEWRSAGHETLRVSVNLSPLQLEQPNLAEVVGDLLRRAGLPGGSLGLEITEGALLESGDIQQRNLRRLKELGVTIVLDDFGTGYSALSYLQQFPIDVIKIDRSFVASMTEERTSAAVVQAVLAMAKGMGLEVVAEGIETAEQQTLLRVLGCRFGQGYLFSCPVPAEEMPLGRI